jgi:biotin carboxyl carrier protein
MTDVLLRPAPSADDAPPSALDVPATSLTGTLAEALALVVAPTTGRFRPTEVDAVRPGEVLGHITGGRGRADAVVAPVGGEVARLLVRPGQLVRAGQQLVWLRAAEVAA